MVCHLYLFVIPKVMAVKRINMPASSMNEFLLSREAPSTFFQTKKQIQLLKIATIVECLVLLISPLNELKVTVAGIHSPATSSF